MSIFMTLLIACLADGADFLRHLFLFNVCIDVLVMASIAAILVRGPEAHLT